MAKIFLTDIDLNGNKLKNAILETVASAAGIATPKEGQLIYDESDKKFKYYNGTAWIAGAVYEAQNVAADSASKMYGFYDTTTQGTGNDEGKTFLKFRAIAITEGQALTIGMDATGIITLGLKLDGTTLTQTANGLKSTLTLKRQSTAETGYAATYGLYDGNDNLLGEKINIDRDKFLKSASIGYANDTFNSTTGTITAATSDKGDAVLHLVFHISDESGEYTKADINIEHFLEESEFDATKGLEVSNHIVAIKISSESESLGEGDDAIAVLGFGADGGLKIAGIQEAIDKAKAAASNTIVVAEGEEHLEITPAAQANGSTKFTISSKDIASAALLGAADDDDTKNTAFGKIAANKKAFEESKINNKLIKDNPTLNGSDIKLGADYTAPEEYSELAADDTLDAAFGKLEAGIKAQKSETVTAYKHAITKDTTSPVTIAATAHKCGKYLLIDAYMNGEKVELGTSINADGDVTISWNGALANDLTIIIMGNAALA